MPAQHFPLLRGPHITRLLMDRESAASYFFRCPWPAIYHAPSRVDYGDRASGE